ncbi:MAG: type II toxin-antitoxin system VapB family antitoxin [Deltaproteobacteria bacterium]|nr:type II toxin-antitoxin system VapB family antitoxin [Deltaproteobacteria bacterium]
MPKQSINMRLDKDLLNEAKKVLGQKGTTATVETALRNMINNRKAIEIFRKTSGKSKWEGFSDGRTED